MRIDRHLLSGVPILVAPERAARPNAFGENEAAGCPFCPGHESETPPEITRIPGPTGWSARVFPNKYPAIGSDGVHELIVESPDHELRFAELSDAAVEALASLYADRYATALSVAGVRHAVIFKNEGARAGASLRHVHSQLLAVPFVPPRIAAEAAAFERGCPLCEGMARFRDEGLVIAEDGQHVRMAAPTPLVAREQWIVPLAHTADMRGLTPAAEASLGRNLRDAARGVARVCGAGASLNWTIQNFACEPRGHWYVSILPRLAALAGYELATASVIAVVLPEVAAADYRAESSRWP